MTGSKAQDKIDETKEQEVPNTEDDESSRPPSNDTLPPQPITLPNFNFRTNFRNIYFNQTTNPSTIPPNKDDNNNYENGEQPPQPKWDEFCIQWCKQQDLNRDKTIVP